MTTLVSASSRARLSCCWRPASLFDYVDPDNLYLDSCVSHIQTFLEKLLMGTYETQIGLHTISNWGQNTASKSGKLLGAPYIGLVDAQWDGQSMFSA